MAVVLAVEVPMAEPLAAWLRPARTPTPLQRLPLGWLPRLPSGRGYRTNQVAEAEETTKALRIVEQEATRRPNPAPHPGTGRKVVSRLMARRLAQEPHGSASPLQQHQAEYPVQRREGQAAARSRVQHFPPQREQGQQHL
mmetsp:Transcript_51572/g.111855  ORF Transcript_51572/g.111855 Transcript_51572/m.111855 type:complete len:140 (+) Transcript_51572:1183-1602(+)